VIHGCQSQVWVDHHRDDAAGKEYFLLDSDAHIVPYFEKLDLISHLSPTRGNGLRAMVQRVKALAAA